MSKYGWCNCENCNSTYECAKPTSKKPKIDWDKSWDEFNAGPRVGDHIKFESTPTTVKFRKKLVKKTSYPESFSLTNAQYRAAMNGMFESVLVVDSRSGASLFNENEWGLAEVLKTACAKVTDTGEIYWVVRF
jgi:hypothetical protein